MEMRLLICLFVLSLKPDVGLARWVGVAGFMVVCLVMSADLVFPFRICFIAAFGVHFLNRFPHETGYAGCDRGLYSW